MAQADEETWRFKIGKTYYDSNFLRRRGEKGSLDFITYYKIEADGYLRRTLSNTTFVSGNTYVSKNTHLFHGFLAGISLIVIVLLMLSTKVLNPGFSATLYILALILFAAQIYNFIAADYQRFTRALKEHIIRVLGR